MQPKLNSKDVQQADLSTLRRRDRAGWMALAVSGLMLSGAYWFYHGGHRGRLVEIDRMRPLDAQFLVNINQADWPEIIQLPGLGEALARRLLADRKTNGPFRDLDEITRVPGIGPLTLKKIRPYLIPIPKETDWAAAHQNSPDFVPQAPQPVGSSEPL